MNLTPLKLPQVGNIDAIDRVKMFAIVSVIILHVFSSRFYNITLTHFHIRQAVPLFMIIAGITLSLSIQKRKYKSPLYALAPFEFLKRANRIILPFALLIIIELFVLMVYPEKGSSLTSGLKNLGYGPGTYFVAIYLQHLVFFPLMIVLDDKLSSYRFELRAACWIAIALAVDYACVASSMPSWFFRIFYGRYILAAIIGRWLLYERIDKRNILLFSFTGIAYIVAIQYFGWRPSFSYPTWLNSHAPAYLYTVSLFLFLWYAPGIIKRIMSPFLILGKASYNIFLVQILYFWLFKTYIHKTLENFVLSTSVALLFCCGLGLLCYYTELWIKENWFAVPTKKSKLSTEATSGL
jgi:peptidoglycan/LPS O-acetylase OafA/YrhL